MITAKQRFKDFMKETGREPTREEFESWGYHSRYWYEIRKKIEKDEEEGKD